jgi:hypothetical protein
MQKQRAIPKWLSIPLLLSPLVLLVACAQGFSMEAIYNSNGTWSIHAVYHVSPPASELANFDASQAVADYTFNNTAVYSRAGNLSVTVSDQTTGAVLGTASFGYTMNSANQLVLNDPAGATQWVRSFSTYNGYVMVNVDVPVQVNAPPAGEGATAASTDLYQGVAQGSASTYFFHCVTPSDPRCRYH